MGKKEEKSKKIPFVLIFIAGILIGFFMYQIYFFVLKGIVANKVKRLYELANPGADIEILAIKDEKSVYKVVIKASDATGTHYREAYVTKDGKYLTEGVILVEESIQQIQKMKNFVDCLYDKGLRIYGVLNQSQSPQGALATSLQLNLLGRYSPKLFVSCEGNLVQNCIDLGIQQIPSIVFEGKIYVGVKSVEWLSDLTGCELE